MKRVLVTCVLAFTVAGMFGAAPTPRRTADAVRFEPNLGQVSSAVRFIGRATDYTVLFEKQSMHVVFRSASDAAHDAGIDLRFIGANVETEAFGTDPLRGTSNYFLGNDPARWRRAVPNYGRIIEQGLYSGIDAVFHSDGRNIEYDFVVAPHGDPGIVRLNVNGAEIAADDRGGVLLRSRAGAVRMAPPVAYQSVGGERRAVSVRYRLDAGPTIGFQVGDYDHGQRLVIDPTLVFSTYLGGSGEDVGNFVTTDPSGNVYVTGRTTSSDFPVLESWQGARAGARDAFVTKYSAAGEMLYSTYFGGTAADNALGVALDARGAIFVTGVTSSIDLPLKNPAQSVYGGGAQDGFIFALTPDGGDLVYSTYLGGTGFDQIRSIAVDSDGDAYVTGNTDSPDFLLIEARQPVYAGGISDAFVTKLDASGAPVFSTYLGGSDYDSGRGIALDANRNIYVAGETRGDFPVTPGSFQPYYGGGLNDLFVTKLSSDGARIVYATYLGGSGTDQNQIQIGTSGGIHGKIVAVDRDGNVYVTGDTDSPDFPLKNPSQPLNSGGVDAFALKLNAAGAGLVWSTFFGGTGFETARGIAITTGGRAWIVGSTASTDLPTRNPLQSAFAGGSFDAFVAEFSRLGQLRFSTYWGGTGLDAGWSIATDESDGVAATGETTSVDFPTHNVAEQAFAGGTADAFVIRLQRE